MGHVPRMMSVIAKGATTRMCSPGDMVTISGVFRPAEDSGRRGFRTGMLQEVFVEAYRITKEKKNYHEQTLSEEIYTKIQTEKGKDNYTRVYPLFLIY
jgi:DNA replication licensing factor MCM7